MSRQCGFRSIERGKEIRQRHFKCRVFGSELVDENAAWPRRRVGERAALVRVDHPDPVDAVLEILLNFGLQPDETVLGR